MPEINPLYRNEKTCVRCNSDCHALRIAAEQRAEAAEAEAALAQARVAEVEAMLLHATGYKSVGEYQAMLAEVKHG